MANIINRLGVISALLATACISYAAPPIATDPTWPLPSHLSALYVAYPHLHQTLGTYADSQGFTGPKERLATILHELIHIDSAAKSAYVIHGLAYAPYNAPAAWPRYSFSQFQQVAQHSGSTALLSVAETPVFRLYVGNAPNNTLANLADELNAYSQTTNWLCRTVSPETFQVSQQKGDERSKSVASMRDMLRVTNAYLSTLRTDAPAQYAALYTQQLPARNLLALTIINALHSLAICGGTLPTGDRTELDALTQRAKQEAQR